MYSCECNIQPLGPESARACGCVLLPGRGFGFGLGPLGARVRARAYVLWGLRSSFELSFDLVAGGVRPTRRFVFGGCIVDRVCLSLEFRGWPKQQIAGDLPRGGEKSETKQEVAQSPISFKVN